MSENEIQENRALCEKALECWFLTGATASGKTTVALELATQLDAEIISLDSMAIYRGMDIGTAKPNAEQRSRVPHHLLDMVDPNESFSVTQYRDMAHEKIDEIRARGKQVIFAGGTALYLKGLLRGIFDGPAADWEFRKAIEKELEEVGIAKLYERLAQVDPVSAQKLHPNDTRRIIRALEVYTTTGKPISHLHTEFEFSTPPEACRVFAIRHPRPVLHQRIEERVATMFDQGLIEEVRGLLEKWGTLGQTAAQAVGYKEVLDFVRSGEGSAELRAETFEKVLTRTRRFARHQETWFRGLRECRILDLTPEMTPASIAESLVAMSESTAS